MKYALTYDDIQLIPKYSDVSSRKNIKLHTLVSKRYGLLRPIVAAPMETVCGYDMAFELARLGGVGCVHRFMFPKRQAQIVEKLKENIYSSGIAENWGVSLDDWHAEIKQVPIMAAIGVQDEDRERAKMLVKAGANILLIDVAHGHHQNVIDMIEWCKYQIEFDHVDIIAGSIATAEAACDLEKAGVDGLRCGVGGGCFTPDMKVLTSAGMKKIIDVEIGDEVYTHTGELKPVINKFEYSDYSEIYNIDGIETTANHKFYVVHTSKVHLVDDTNIHDYAEWVYASDLTTEHHLIEL
jgi:IMP dehydrogenase